ncbi:hypothetical protein [Fenollaria sporofastidiosus]|uniref:hypothetical protein n=1 Tax=Fenollaria sporofastidiosus TaxID=2811778 RepID=UPI001C003160|nr:hypothetical protein [Fenollaria sporofastidiosus]
MAMVNDTTLLTISWLYPLYVFGLDYRKMKTFDEKMTLDRKEKRILENQKKFYALTKSEDLNFDQKSLLTYAYQQVMLPLLIIMT